MKNYVGLFILTILFFFLIFFPHFIFAQSNYVLPYPSFMPGSKLYVMSELWDRVMKYWYFGDFAQFKYSLGQSDKYLVQAKTLFEYKQYLLGYKALQKTDSFFSEAFSSLERAKQKGEDINGKKALFQEAAKRHTEVLRFMESITPEQFTWQPEDNPSTSLQLKANINKSIMLREKFYNE